MAIGKPSLIEYFDLIWILIDHFPVSFYTTVKHWEDGIDDDFDDDGLGGGRGRGIGLGLMMMMVMMLMMMMLIFAHGMIHPLLPFLPFGSPNLFKDIYL